MNILKIEKKCLLVSPKKMNKPVTIPPALALIRNQLIDIALGSRVNLPEHDDIEELVEWIHTQTSYEVELGQSISPNFEYFLSDEAIKDEEGEEVEINDELRIEFIRQKIDSCAESRTQLFTLQLNNKVNEEAYLGGSVLNMGQGGWVWDFYGCYKSIELFEEEIHKDEFLFGGEMQKLSDQNLLAKWKKGK